MRVCMFTSSSLPTIGGLQFQVKWLTDELARQGEEIYLVTPQTLGSTGKILTVLKLLKIIRELNPDVIHVHCVLPDGLCVILPKILGGTPLIITSHGIDIVKFKEINYGYRLNPLYSLMIKSILKLCDKHVLVSNALSKFAMDAGSSNITVIPNGIPTRKTVSQQQINKVKEKYGLANKKILLTLSGMRPLKGLEYLIKAMPKILRENPNTRLIMTAGQESSSYKRHLKRLIQHLNITDEVTFTGFVLGNEKTALIQLCDIFCLPSIFEAFGISLLEAMQFEKGIVATKAGGPLEVIENYVDGLLVPPKNPEAIAEAVNLLLANEKLRTKLGKEASKHVKRFDIKNIAEKYVKLYKEVVAS